MKTTATYFRLSLLTGIFAATPFLTAFAADTNSVVRDNSAAPAPTAPAAVVSAAATTPKLPYGVEDVLKLSRAQIGEEVILNYVKSSGTIYNLSPKDIVYLRDQGVSEKVLTAMLDQRKQVELVAQTAAAPVPSGVPNAPGVANAPTVADASTAPAAPVYADQSATYAEAPLTPPASSVYVIPYPAASYAYYGSYYSPYYGPAYYGWCGPSFVFGFGGHGGYYYGHGGYHGGYHGGHGSFAHGGGGHR